MLPPNLFTPGGAFAENIRSTVNGDLNELVASFKAHGWVAEFPALVDENGVVLVGHRRMKAAEIAGIEPVVKQLMLGSGDAADAERVRLAIVSNIGGKPLTKEDRQRIAQHLYGSREWTMQRIAEALNVGKTTVQRDISNCSTVEQLNPHTKTASNPKGAGRPKTTTAGESDVTRKIRDYVRPLVERGEPLSVQDVAKATGHSRIVSEAAIAAERGRQEGIAEASEALGDPSQVLSKSAQEKLATFERRVRAELEAKYAAEFEQRVRDDVERRLAARDKDDLELIEQCKVLVEHSTGRARKPFTANEFRQLQWALHQDHGNNLEKRHNAFAMVTNRKLILCEDGPIKRKSDDAKPLPKTAADLVRVKRTKGGASR